MAGKPVYEYPPDEELARLVAEKGCQQVANELGFAYSTLRTHLANKGLPTTKGKAEPASGRTITVDAEDLPKSPWTPDSLLKSHGLDKGEWRIVRVRANRWGEEDDPKVQLRIDVEPTAPPFEFPDPAKWKPLPKPRPKKKKGKAKVSIVLSDFHAPHHDKDLFELTCRYLEDSPPDEIIINGDLMDAATVSTHRTIPGGGYDQPLQANIDAAYSILRQLRHSCPNTVLKLQRGNHDERIENALIDQLSALYGLRAAGSEVPALSLQNLLHLDALRVEYSDQPWDRSKIQLLDNYRLAVRHGVSTTKNPGRKILTDLAGSTIQGHSHRLSLYYATSHHPEDGPETRVAAEAGCMAEIHDGLGYAHEPSWQQGFLICHSWPGSNAGPKDDFTIAPAIYLPGRLLIPDGRRYDK